MRFKRFWTSSDNTKNGLLSFYLAMTVLGIAAGITRNFITPYMKSWGLTESLIGVASSAGAFAAMLISLPGGRIVDRIGPKPVIIIELAAVTVITLMFPLAGFATAVFVLYVLLQSTHGLDMPTTTPYIHGSTSMSNRAKWMSVYMLTFYLGSIIGPPIGGFVSAHFGIPSIFYISAAVCALSLVFAARLPSKIAKQEAKLSLFSINDIRETLATKVLTTILGGCVSDMVGRKAPVIIGCAVGATCFGLMPVAMLASPDTAARLIIVGALQTIQSAGFGFSNPSIMALMSETMPSNRIGTGMGVYYMLATFGWVIGAPLAGMLYEINFVFPFALGGVVTLVSVMVLTYMVPETGKRLSINISY